MSERISPNALDVLAAATVEGHGVRLPRVQLDRALYEEVNDVLLRLGGKWKRRGAAKGGIPQGTHELPYDPAPLLAAVVETGARPPKNPTAFFPTPPDVVARMLAWADLSWLDSPGCRILEPSAGTGAIADAIRSVAPNAVLDVVEVLPINAAMLRRKGYAPHEMDFLDWRPAYQYDAVLMNPPFSLDGDPLAYITHIRHAWDLLRDGGELVSITPNGFTHRSDTKCREFLEMVGEYGDSGEIEAGAFKESGTGIATRIVYLKKDDQRWKAAPFQGWPTWHTWAAELWATSEREFHNDRARLFERIRSGALSRDLFGAPEPATRDAIVAHYRTAVDLANKSFEGVRPTEADYAHLIEHFLVEYREWLAWEESRQPAATRKEAA